jgi:hypothetical protein
VGSAVTLSQGGLEETDHVAVGVAHGGDPLPAADVPDLLPELGAGIDHAVWTAGGRPRVVFLFTIERGRVTRIDLVADPAQLADADVVPLGD